MSRRARTHRPLATLVLAVATITAAGCGDSAADEREVPMRERPEVDVELIGEGTVSTQAPEFAASLTPNGDTLYFTRSTADRSELTIYRAVRDSAGWSEPEVAPFSGTHRDVDPFVTPDGSRIYFSSDRPAPVDAADFNTWWVDREEGGWSEPRTAGPPLNSPGTDVFVSATSEGVVYFSSRRQRGGQRVYRIEPTDDGWGAAVLQRFGEVAEAGNPLVDPDGEFILFVNVGPGGSANLFLACATEEGWGEPRSLPRGVNTEHADFAPGLDPTDGSLLFTSERPGVVATVPDSGRAPGDLYRADFRPDEQCD